MTGTKEQNQWPALLSVDQREASLLATYAMHSANSLGRKYPQSEHPYRGPFQRDRDRVVHCSAFRRLSGKTQVFTGMGDYHRTRLTHTMEVASLARTIGRALGLNEDLIESLALLHDIGHPPFGHAGEDALGQCMTQCGGFSHNRYALTIVEELEIRYQAFPGLNLTYEVLESQSFRIDKNSALRPLLETQVVDAADSITYDAHDTDDAVKLGLVELDEILEIPLVRHCAQRVYRRDATLCGPLLRKAIVYELLDGQVSDVIKHSGEFLASAGFDSVQEARQSDFIIGPSDELAEQKTELERFLRQRVYRHPEIIRVREQAQRQLKEMFAGYVDSPDLLPEKLQFRAETVEIIQVVGDYLAGMTDRFCQQQYQQHFQDKTGGATGKGPC